MRGGGSALITCLSSRGRPERQAIRLRLRLERGRVGSVYDEADRDGQALRLAPVRANGGKRRLVGC